MQAQPDLLIKQPTRQPTCTYRNRGLSSAPQPDAVDGADIACTSALPALLQWEQVPHPGLPGERPRSKPLCFLWSVSEGENLPVVPAHRKTADLLISTLETRGKSSPEAEPESSSDANKIWLRFRSCNSRSMCFSAARARTSSAASSSSHCLQGN